MARKTHVTPGEDDLQTKRPEIAKDWDHSKNSEKPNEVFEFSNKRVWWVCDKGHSWQAIIHARTYKGRGCAVCVNQKILPGYNDLGTQYPEVAKEWHPRNNGNLLASGVSSGSAIRRWWLCAVGHEWLAPPYNRTKLGSGCPNCSSSGTSKMEKDLAQVVAAMVHPMEVELNSRKYITNPATGRGLELDVYVPELKVAIEFNGKYWHSDAAVQSSRGMTAADYDKLKASLCEEVGIRLILVTEVEWVKQRTAVLDKLREVLVP